MSDGWLSGRSSSEALGLEALISQSAGHGWIDWMTRSLFVSSVIMFPYFDLMSRMAVWKEQLGGTGFGSADQPEH